MNKLLLSAALLLPCALAQAASFDCAHAGSANEKLICGDPELSAMDDSLGKAFRQARARAEDKRAFRKQSDVQWQWREQNCHDRACLVQWYGRRQGELQALAEGSMSMAAKLPVKAVPVVAAVTAAPAAVLQTAPALAPPAARVASLPAPATPPIPPVPPIPAAIASAPPAAPAGLKLSLSAAQIAGVAPAGATPWPHYVRVDKGEYFYEDAHQGNALVTVRYYGVAHGQHILEASRGKQILRYTCSADCAYIGELPLPGDEEKDMVFVPNDRHSLPSLMVSDAINGLLIETRAR